MMNNLNQFPFYKNYYELIDNLPTNDKRLMLEVVLDYMFKDVEPINLEKMNLAIWNNIKLPLYSIKKNILNGQKGGRPKKEENLSNNPNNNPSLNPNNNPRAKQNSIFNFYLLIYNFKYFNNTNQVNEYNEVNNTNIIYNINNYINVLGKKIKEWLDYKWEKKEYYKETGFKTLLKQIQKASEQYGQEKVIEIIDESMANNYQGIIFDKLKKQQLKKQPSPNWVGKTYEQTKATKEEEQEMKDLLKEYGDE